MRFAPLACAAIVTTLGGCSSSEAPESESAGDVARYTVRGQIVVLPSADNPAAELQIRHEPIPDFRSGGEIVGMRAMVMPFPVGEGVSLDGIEIDDKVEFTFETVYSADTQLVESYTLVAITELPAETELVFDGAPPDGE